MDAARKTAVAAEIAILAAEVARQFAASQAAATKLAEITILTSSSSKPTDYANPPKTGDWSIPNQPVGETDLAPTGGLPHRSDLGVSREIAWKVIENFLATGEMSEGLSLTTEYRVRDIFYCLFIKQMFGQWFVPSFLKYARKNLEPKF